MLTMKKEDLPQVIRERVESELLTGENLLWVGLPARKHIPRDSYNNRTASAILLGMIVSMLLGTTIAAGTVARTWGVMMAVLLTMIILGTAVVYAVWQSRQNFPHLYAITNRRALILTRTRVQSFGADDIHFIERNMHRDGKGDIIFREEHYKRLVPVGEVVIQKGERITTGFYGIDNPTQVEALMLETFRHERQAYQHLEDEVAVLYDGS
jgi:hypothetical protein